MDTKVVTQIILLRKYSLKNKCDKSVKLIMLHSSGERDSDMEIVQRYLLNGEKQRIKSNVTKM